MQNWAISVRSRLAEDTRYPWLIFFSVTTGTFMVNVDSSILSVALPALQQDFGVPTYILQWVISAYLLVVTGILPTIGRLSDLRGRKNFFVAGVSIFTIASILSALSSTIEQLIGFRVLQAVGGAMIMGNVMSIVADTFPAGKRGRPLGFIGSIVAAGTIVGPSLGGLLIAKWGWQSIFWINVPVGILSIVGTLILLPNKKPIKKQAHLDWYGAVSFFIAISTLLMYMSNGHQWGWMSTLGVSTLAISVVAWFFYIYRSLHTEHPLIELSLFQIRNFAVGNTAGFLSFVLLMIPSTIMPLYLNNVLHVPIYQIGLIMAAQAVAMIIASPISGWLSDRFGNQWPSIIGMAITTVGLYLMTWLGISSTTWQVTWTLALFGAGNAFFQSPNNVSVLESVPAEKTGVTGGIIATVRNFGRVTGVALAIFLLQWAGGSEHTAAAAFAKESTFVFGAGVWIGVLSLLLLASRWIGPQKKTPISP